MRRTLRPTLRLIPAAPPAPIALRTLPCRVCGACSDTPAVIAAAGPVAYCTFAHAALHGWPWLQSETAVPAPAGQAEMFSPH